jgi:hypothetical protein
MQDGRLEALQYLLSHLRFSHVENIVLRLEACDICTGEGDVVRSQVGGLRSNWSEIDNLQRSTILRRYSVVLHICIVTADQKHDAQDSALFRFIPS